MCFESELHQWVRISLFRHFFSFFWWIVLCEQPMRDSLHATHVMHTWLICFRGGKKKKKKTVCDLCRDPLQRLSASEPASHARTHTHTHTHTHTQTNKGLGGEWWRVVLTGRGSGSCSWAGPVTQEDGGWRRGGGEEVQDFDLSELQVHSGQHRYPSLRQTDRSRSAVHRGRILGSFITVFS